MSKYVSILFATLAMTFAAPAQAQHTTTTVANGSDFWTGSMSPEIFQLHENGGSAACTGTEVFVTVRGSLGFCMDANENAAGALAFEDAREVCTAAGKRLPEPLEFKFACQAAPAGLNNMTNNMEWASNFPVTERYIGTTTTWSLHAPQMGLNSCLNFSHGTIARQDLAQSTIAFRCVR